MVCYYGRHYLSLVRIDSDDGAIWWVFDDALVRRVGGWQDVLDTCITGSRQPSVLLFQSVQYGTVRYSTVQYGTVRYSMVQYGTVRYRLKKQH